MYPLCSEDERGLEEMTEGQVKRKKCHHMKEEEGAGGEGRARKRGIG